MTNKIDWLREVTGLEDATFGLANFPVAYCGLKIITSLALRFPDFQRQRWPKGHGFLIKK
jgi:hypothetical protein